MNENRSTEINVKIKKLKSQTGYKGFKAVRIRQKQDKIEVCVKNGKNQMVTSSAKSATETYKRLIEIIEGIHPHEKI